MKQGFIYDCMLEARASAQRSPSIAAETMPPAYPAPSPQGYSPLMAMWESVSGSRVTLTGEDVRVSQPISTASLVRNPLAFLPKSINPFCSRRAIPSGRRRSTRAGCIPGAYDVAGRSFDGRLSVKSFMRWAGALWVLPASS